MWRKDFQVFEDKSDAINLDTGIINNQLTHMLLQFWRQPDQKLAVGKPEYKTIIEATLKIPCLHDEAVVEMMRGLNYLLDSIVPEEKSPKQGECLRTSRGLQMLLNRYGFSDVEPNMVDQTIIEMSCILYDCDCCQKNWSESLRLGSHFLEEVSSIDSEDWDIVKLATALKMVCYPDEEITFGDPKEMFSADELSKLVADAPKYEGSGIIKGTIRRLYDETLIVLDLKTETQRRLASYVRWLKKYMNMDVEQHK
uniref:Uncharacterized protein n=1 Tax=Avena sativa TaxID=4498 RepID=A0ACD5WAZ0_AVESA